MSEHASVPVAVPSCTDAQNCQRGVRQWQDSRLTPKTLRPAFLANVSRVDTCTVATANWHKTSALVRFPSTDRDCDTNQEKRPQTCYITSARNLANNVCHFVSLKWLVTGRAQHVNTPLVQCTIMCASRKTHVVGGEPGLKTGILRVLP